MRPTKLGQALTADIRVSNSGRFWPVFAVAYVSSYARANRVAHWSLAGLVLGLGVGATASVELARSRTEHKRPSYALMAGLTASAITMGLCGRTLYRTTTRFDLFVERVIRTTIDTLYALGSEADVLVALSVWHMRMERGGSHLKAMSGCDKLAHMHAKVLRHLETRHRRMFVVKPNLCFELHDTRASDVLGHTGHTGPRGAPVCARTYRQEEFDEVGNYVVPKPVASRIA